MSTPTVTSLIINFTKINDQMSSDGSIDQCTGSDRDSDPSDTLNDVANIPLPSLASPSVNPDQSVELSIISPMTATGGDTESVDRATKEEAISVSPSDDSPKNISYSISAADNIATKPSKKKWLTEDIIARLDTFKPTQTISSDQDIIHSQYVNAFLGAFADPDYLHWQNQYQLHQSIDYMATMYGFSTNYSGYKIFCACGQSHLQKKKSKSDHTQATGFTAPIKKSRKTSPMTSLCCNMSISCSCIHRPKAGDGYRKEQRLVKVTSLQLAHNHKLNKSLMIRPRFLHIDIPSALMSVGK